MGIATRDSNGVWLGDGKVFFGTSSPISIDATLATNRARPILTAGLSVTPVQPIRVSRGSNRSASAGSAMAPVSSDVTVIPSCAPDNSKES